MGAWGSGIALQLKQQYPVAYNIYESWCKETDPEDLMGTCLLIPPQSEDPQADAEVTTQVTQSTSSQGNEVIPAVFIACLFTSKGYGRGNKKAQRPPRSSKTAIVKATEQSLTNFLVQYNRLGESDDQAHHGDAASSARPRDIFSVRINAGSFGVPWETSNQLIKKIWDSTDVTWTVVSR